MAVFASDSGLLVKQTWCSRGAGGSLPGDCLESDTLRSTADSCKTGGKLELRCSSVRIASLERSFAGPLMTGRPGLNNSKRDDRFFLLCKVGGSAQSSAQSDSV